MAFSRRKWGEMFTIYTYGKITVTCQLSSYDFTTDCATFQLKASMNYENRKYDYSTNIYFYNRDDESKFKKSIIKNIIFCFENVGVGGSWSGGVLKKIAAMNIDERTCYDYDYKEKVDLIEEFGLSSDWEEANNIENDKFKDLAIEEVIDQVDEKINDRYVEAIEKEIERILPQTDWTAFKTLLGKVE
jgi:hypothetical protein